MSARLPSSFPARCRRLAAYRTARVGLAAGLAWLALALPLPAAEPPPLAAQLAGKTLSAVVYRSRKPGPVSGAGLQRLVVQAYLQPDGRSLVREWDAAHDRYTAPARTRWSLSGQRLCIGLPGGPLCADIHIWAPRIAGIGLNPYAMLDGDLQAGNALVGAR